LMADTTPNANEQVLLSLHLHSSSW